MQLRLSGLLAVMMSAATAMAVDLIPGVIDGAELAITVLMANDKWNADNILHPFSGKRVSHRAGKSAIRKMKTRVN
jgi:hypothetical protein